uniref:Uncharacterized protein n=1 Tax=Tanacetum cinerariifolium TaxID=118510 RepID=A0A699H8F2_TANCI|nr:hypothetical protein [Tanacetum cinerariifolium]
MSRIRKGFSRRIAPLFPTIVAVYKELDERLVMATSPASRLEVEQNNGTIDAIDSDEDITLVNVQADVEIFDADKDLGGKEVFIEQEVVADKGKINEVTLAQHDKRKGIMVKEPVKHKKKDQIRLDEEATLKLKAKFDKEQRLAREKAKKELEANVALIETRDDVQVKIDVDHQLAE